MTGTDTIVSGHSVFTCVCVCVCVCVRVWHTHTHTHTYIYISTYIHTHKHIHTHIHTYTYLHTCIHTHTQTPTHTNIHKSIHKYGQWAQSLHLWNSEKKKLKPSTYITPKAPYRGCFERHYLEGTFANVYDPEEHRQRCHQRREKALFRV